MKKVLLMFCLFFGSLQANAQLPNGSIAPDFTVTDINGNTHNLYSYLDQGYSVVLDFSTTWCGPCWGYHTSGELEDLWMNHGPAGEPGVSANTTDDVMVFYMESDAATNMDDLNGTGTSTQGDWVTGTDYPIVDDASVQTDFAVEYYPTIYTVCPNRKVSEANWQVCTSSYLYTTLGTCAGPVGATNGSLIGYTGESISCGGPIPITMNVQNMGSADLTALTLEVFDGTTSVLTHNWTGSLSTFQIEEVTLGSLSPTASTTYSVEITSTDDDNSDNMASAYIDVPVPNVAATQDITIEIVTDAYGSETTWEIVDGSGTPVISGGPYSDIAGGNPGTTVEPPLTFTVDPSSCYIFTIFDSYGDGMDAGYGAGSYTIKDNTGAVLLTGGVFTTEEASVFRSGTGTSSIIENELSNLSVYPNPAHDEINISFEGSNTTYSISIRDLSGRLVLEDSIDDATVSKSKKMNTEGISEGTYIVSVKSENGEYSKKVVIK